MLSGTHYRSKHSPAGRGWLPSNSQRQAWKVNTQWHVNVRSVPLKGRTPAKVVTGLFFPLMSSKCPASFGMRRAPADTAEQLFPSRTPRGGGGQGRYSFPSHRCFPFHRDYRLFNPGSAAQRCQSDHRRETLTFPPFLILTPTQGAPGGPGATSFFAKSSGFSTADFLNRQELCIPSCPFPPRHCELMTSWPAVWWHLAQPSLREASGRTCELPPGTKPNAVVPRGGKK